MVKFGRKFFKDNTTVKKNKIATILIIVSVILIIITTFFITSKFMDKNDPNIKKVIEPYESININLYDEIPFSLSYFKKLENIKIGEIKVNYPDNFNFGEDYTKCSEKQKDNINRIKAGFGEGIDVNEAMSCIIYKANTAGQYSISINVGKDEYKSTLIVTDDTPPVLVTKNVEIYENERYNEKDFVESCADNDQKECRIEFLNTSLVNYSNYKEPGEYQIKIVAKDSSGNQSEAQIVKLTIKKIIYYTVKFNTNGGTAIPDQTIREGERANYVSAPTKANYTFEGWVYNNQEWQFDTPITSDITIEAKWKKIETYIPPEPQEPSGGGKSTGGGSTGGKSTGGGSSSSGGKEETKCETANDFYGDISVYDYMLENGSKNDCLKTSGNTNKAIELMNKYSAEASKQYKQYYAYDYPTCIINTNKQYTGLLSESGSKHVGYLITYTTTSDCSNQKQKLTLYCKSATDCSLY